MNVGIDIVEIDRIQRCLEHKAFLKKVYSDAEIELFEKKKMNIETIAGRFCVKEAFSKALGTGIRNFEMTDITTLNDELGAPYLILENNAKKALGDRKTSVSISHTKTYATAIVIIY